MDIEQLSGNLYRITFRKGVSPVRFRPFPLVRGSSTGRAGGC